MVSKIFSDNTVHLKGIMQGVPEHTAEDITLKTCLREIDRCKEDNIMPYFLNMTRWFLDQVFLF